MFFILGLLSIEKLIQFDCCIILTKLRLIKNMYMFTVFWNWLDERIFLNYSSKLKPGANKINIDIITAPL